MVSVSEAILLEEVSCAGSSRSAAEGDSDPRLIEQPHSAIAINASGADAPRPGREAPEKRAGTGIAIATGRSRGLRNIGNPPRRKMHARIPQKWIPVLRSEYAQTIKAGHFPAANRGPICRRKMPCAKKMTRAQGPRHGFKSA